MGIITSSLSCWELIHGKFLPRLWHMGVLKGQLQSSSASSSTSPPLPLKIQPVLQALKFYPHFLPRPFPESLKSRGDLPFSKCSDHCLCLLGTHEHFPYKIISLSGLLLMGCELLEVSSPTPMPAQGWTVKAMMILSM